jgi:hypothetical protein
LQATTEVLDMRTIVECSPQFGHTDTSSNRRRHHTHRYRPGTAVGLSHGSPQFGHSIPSLVSELLTGTFRLSAAPAQPGDEEAIGPVAVRQQLRTALIGELVVLGEKSFDQRVALDG